MKQLVLKMSETVEHLRTSVATQENQNILLTIEVIDLQKRVPAQKTKRSYTSKYCRIFHNFFLTVSHRAWKPKYPSQSDFTLGMKLPKLHLKHVINCKRNSTMMEWLFQQLFHSNTFETRMRFIENERCSQVGKMRVKNFL